MPQHTMSGRCWCACEAQQLQDGVGVHHCQAHPQAAVDAAAKMTAHLQFKWLISSTAAGIKPPVSHQAVTQTTGGAPQLLSQQHYICSAWPWYYFRPQTVGYAVCFRRSFCCMLTTTSPAAMNGVSQSSSRLEQSMTRSIQSYMC